MKNVLEMDRSEFARAMRSFHVRELAQTALLAFEGSILSIESGAQVVTMHADGEWHGRAWFSSNLVKALIKVPPTDDPIVIAYDGAKLRVGSITVGCDWELVSKAFVKDVTRPSLLDLLAMNHSLPRSEIHGTGLSKRIEHARFRLDESIKKAAKLLKEAEISEADLWDLAEKRIQGRFETRSG